MTLDKRFPTLLLYAPFSPDVRISSLPFQDYCRAEMYAGRVACCRLVSHVEYALRNNMGRYSVKHGIRPIRD